jgi:Zn-dependent protease/CBS domain-containing protein
VSKRVGLMNIGQSWQIGRIFGIPLKVHVSWFLVFLLVTWLLAQSYFPHVLPNLPVWEAWALGMLAALLLFASVLVHELGHCVVAMRYHIPIGQITLFIFGGMAQIRREAPTPKAEFLIAIAGPIVSLVISFTFLGLTLLPGVPAPFAAVFEQIQFGNLILALFNLVPGYPLDGGRVLRAAIWAWSKNFHKATRLAARAGQLFSVLLVMLGIVAITMGSALNGMWLMLVAGFLYVAAQNSHRQTFFQESLSSLSVGDVMTQNVVGLETNQTVDKAVNNYFLRYGFGGFPVIEEGRLVGMVSLKELTAVPRETWNAITVGQVMIPSAPQFAVHAQEPLTAAMDRMMQEDRSRLIVTQGDNVVGIITRSGIRRHLDEMQK